MTATVHSLHEQPLPGEAQPQAAQAPRAAASHPLVEELRRTVQSACAERLDELFAQAAQTLGQMAEASFSAEERRAHFDCIKTLRLEQTRLTRGFELAVNRQLNGQTLSGETAELDRMALLPAEELEENIALTRMASRAKTQFHAALVDIEARLERLANGMALPLAPRVLSPTRFCEAFRSSLEGLDLEFPLRAVCFKLFERYFLGQLDRVYGEVATLLNRHQVAGGVRAAPLAVDALTLRMLEDMGGFASKASFSDAMLASELLDLSRGKQVPHGESILQRLALVGRMFNEILEDPYLPGDYLPLFERLRFSTIKTALADISFFVNHAHPVRWLVQDAAQMAVAARIGGEAAVQYTGDRLTRLPDEFNISAAFVRPALSSVEPLTDAQTVEFLDMLRAETAARRADLLTKARRVVAQELEVLTLGHALHSGAQRLLRMGYSPILVVCLLKQGMHSNGWNETLAEIGALLEALQASRQPDTAALALREAREASIRARLRDIGLRDDKLEALIGGLREAQTVADASATAPVPSAPVVAVAEPAPAPIVLLTPPPANEAPAAPNGLRDVLSSLLRPESWFRVYNVVRNESKWLKVSRYYPEQDRVAFAGFNSENQLTLRASEFAEDLKAARSEAISPSPEVAAALERLRAA